jgi:hypothetical protein
MRIDITDHRPPLDGEIDGLLEAWNLLLTDIGNRTGASRIRAFQQAKREFPNLYAKYSKAYVAKDLETRRRIDATECTRDPEE